MDDYISKPLRPDQLDAVLERWLGARARSRPRGGNGGRNGLIDAGAYPRLPRRLPGDRRPAGGAVRRHHAAAARAAHATPSTRATTSAVRRLAHKLKGSCENVGATRMAALCRQLEEPDGAPAPLADGRWRPRTRPRSPRSAARVSALTRVSSRSRAGPSSTARGTRRRAPSARVDDSHGSTMSSAWSSAKPALNASSPRRPAAIFSASRRFSPSEREGADQEVLVRDRRADLHRRVPRGQHRQVVLVEVIDRLGVVRRELLLGDLVDPRAHQLAQQLATRLAPDRLGDDADGVLRLDETQWHDARARYARDRTEPGWLNQRACTSPITCAPSIRRGRAVPGSGTRRTSGRARRRRARSGARSGTPRPARRTRSSSRCPAAPPAGARFAGVGRGAGPLGGLGPRGGRRGGRPCATSRARGCTAPRCPRTKLESPLPDAVFTGWVEAGGRRTEVAGWRGMVGHNWGSEHAERWVWLHGVGFAEAPGAWLDVAIGRVRVGRAVDAVGGERRAGAGRRAGWRSAGCGRVRSTRVDARPGSLRAVIGGAGVTIRATVSAPLEQTVAFVADPGGGSTTRSTARSPRCTCGWSGRGGRLWSSRQRSAAPTSSAFARPTTALPWSRSRIRDELLALRERDRGRLVALSAWGRQSDRSADPPASLPSRGSSRRGLQSAVDILLGRVQVEREADEALADRDRDITPARSRATSALRRQRRHDRGIARLQAQPGAEAVRQPHVVLVDRLDPDVAQQLAAPAPAPTQLEPRRRQVEAARVRRQPQRPAVVVSNGSSPAYQPAM